MMRLRLINHLNPCRCALSLLAMMLTVTMALLPQSAWATDYPLIVAGVQVTDANATNVLGEDYATVSYDNTTSTLTLKACQYSPGETIDNFINVGSGLESLTVHFLGNNAIGMYVTTLFNSDSDCTITLTTDATIPGKLEFNGENLTSGTGNMTIDYETSGLEWDKNSKTYQASAGTDGIIYFGTGQFHGAEEGSSEYDAYPAFCYTTSFLWYFNNAQTTNGNTYLPPTVTSAPEGDVYTSRMRTSGGGIIKTLSFQCDIISSGDDVQVALVGIEDETTYATGTLNNGIVTLTPTGQVSPNDVCLVFTSSSEFSFLPLAVKMIITQRYDITVAGMAITGDNASDVLGDGTVSFDAENNILTLNNATLTESIVSGLTNLIVDVKGVNSITTDMAAFTVDTYESSHALTIKSTESPAGQLTLRNTNQENSCGGVIADAFSLTIDESISTLRPQYVSLTMDTIHVAQFGPTYDLTVAGVQVNSANASDITGDLIIKSGAGKVSFDATTNTLAMTGGVLIGNGGIAWGIDDALTVRISGKENRIVSATSSAIYCTENNIGPTARNLYIVEGNAIDTCEITIQTPSDYNNIGDGFTQTYQESSRLVDYVQAVTSQGTEWTAKTFTTTISSPFIHLSEDVATPHVVVSSATFDYTDQSFYISTDGGQNYSKYVEPVELAEPGTMVLAYTKVRDNQSAVVKGKYIDYLTVPSKLAVGKDSIPTLCSIGDEDDDWTISSDAVIYESSNEAVASFADGKVKAVGIGTATLTTNLMEAIQPKDETNVVYPLMMGEGVLSFTVDVVPLAPMVSIEGGTYDEAQTVEITSPEANGQSATVRYYLDIYNPKIYSEVLTISETTTLHAWVEVVSDDGGTTYTSDTTTVAYTIRVDPGLTYNDDEGNPVETATYVMDMPDQTLPTLQNANKLEVTYQSSTPAVATVSATGEVTVVGIGETTITATFDATGNAVYKDATAHYVLTVQRALDISFGTRTWATYCAAEDLATPDGLSAYRVTEVAGNTVTAEAIRYIPQGIGILLERQTGAVVDSYVASAYGGSSQQMTSLLTGTFEEKAVATVTDAAVYVLYNDEFVKATAGTIPAHRGYLTLSGTSAVADGGAGTGGETRQLPIALDGDVTGISTVRDSLPEGGDWYTLDGRKLDGKPTVKGLYIRNGQKIIIK